jgi:D-alanyl-D-alanine carboxypeptidase (penicillin-binding protein 5/6)
MRCTRRAAALGAAVALLAAAGLATAGPAAAVPPPPPPTAVTPDTSACPYRTSPPAPVDTSEQPAPGQAAPAPMPVPAAPVGGPRLGECGLVLPAGAPPLPADETSTGWVIADLDTGAVLAAKDPHGRQRPASTLKVLFMLVALTRLTDVDEVVTATQEDADQVGSRVGVGPDGRYTVRQLIQGSLLRSGNDAVHTLTRRLGGTGPTLSMMDDMAARLGALDTRAATPPGLDAAGMSTSAYDLGVLFRQAMMRPLFAQTVGTAAVDFPGYRDKPGFRVTNDDKLLTGYAGALGGKTGFTDDARHTFVGAAQQTLPGGGTRRLLVTLVRGEQRPVPMWQQAARLLDYGFARPAGGAPVGRLVDQAPPPDTGQAGATAPTVTTTPGPGTGAATNVASPTERDDMTPVLAGGLATLAGVAGVATWALRRRRRGG